MEGLPDELLEDVLRRLSSPRDLAVCRSVRKDWRAAVDTHGLLLVGPVRGVFVNYLSKRRHGFLSRLAPPPAAHPSIDGTLRFLPDRPTRLLQRFRGVLDHRNGLLLYEDTLEMYVCNPATRRWATVPGPPRVPPPFFHRVPFYRRRLYLLFDPTVSMHYDVMFLPDAPVKPKPPAHHVLAGGGQQEHEYNATGSMEWPPCSYQVQVFSSRTGQWEDKDFVREEGNAALTVSDVWSDPTPRASGVESIRRHGVCWREALYVHCCGDFVIRLSLLEHKYRVIKTPTLHVPPPEHNEDYYKHSNTLGYLGKSNDGVCYGAINGYQLQVWILREEASESHPRPEYWEVKHQANLKPTFLRHYNRHDIGRNSAESWILHPHDKLVSEDREDHGWDSSDDSVVADMEEQEIISLEGYKKHYHYYGLDFLGYHPYQEIVFLGNSFNAFAYYLDSSKLQYLGSLLARSRLSPHWAPVFESFIYTPCMKDLLPAHHDM